MLSMEERNILLEVAHQSIQHGLEHSSAIIVNINDCPASLREERATFVTLNLYGQLRGCIGTLEAHQPLVQDVAHNAYAAAFSDPRFPALTTREFEKIEMHISILSPSEEIDFTSEEDLLQQIRPNIDGLVLSDGYARGTFLPAVWESLKTPQEFLQHLKLKAGLPANYWSDTIRVERYTTESFP